MAWCSPLLLLPIALVATTSLNGPLSRGSENMDGLYSGSSGIFWQVTDVHYDANYSMQGLPADMCHIGGNDVLGNDEHPGMFGAYLCDSPWALATSAVNAMKDIDPKPDFILWTGDSFPHVSVDTFDQEKVFTTIGNVTQLLLDNYPDTNIFPTIGNHDNWPPNLVPTVAGDAYYDGLLKTGLWDETITNARGQENFRQSGSYMSQLSSKLRLLNLNTILWYETYTENVTDPLQQLKWLEKQLLDARNEKMKVWLAGHVPPGVLRYRGYNPIQNKPFLVLARQFKDVITAMIFGHEHRDEFRVIMDDGMPAIPVFLAPSVTPLTHNISLGANYPSIRRYTYDAETGLITDIKQYYMNLTQANIQKETTWQLEYEFKKAYDVEKLDASTLASIAESFRQPKHGWFEQYFFFFSVSYPPIECSDTCRIAHYCAILAVDYEDNAACIDNAVTSGDFDSERKESEERKPSGHHPDDERIVTNNLPPGHHLHVAMYIIVAFMVVLIIVSTMSVYCWRRNKSKRARVEPRYALIT